MRIPRQPPNFEDCWAKLTDANLLKRLRDHDVLEFIRTSNDKYLHWDKLRYHPLPDGFNPECAWAAVYLSRAPQLRAIPITFIDNNSELVFWTPPQQQEWLHKIDQQAGGSIGTNSRFGIPDDEEKYLVSSLMEEAIASSQLEGATTTREVAKRMLRLNRKPRDRSQQMILNNYLAIRELRELKHESLTPELLCHVQEIITHNTLDDPLHCGRLRRPGDSPIVVEDSMTGDTLYTPPSHFQVDWRVDEICEFANEKTKPFIHPILKAIALHFAIGFVHPFIDGNGRTARAVFYWYMLKRGYWAFEYLPISRIFLDGPSKYARAYLYTENSQGDLTYFIHYHLQIIIRAIRDLHEYISEQQKELRDAAALLGCFPEINHRQTFLIYHAIRNQGASYSIAQHAGKHNVTKATARSDLFGLVDRGLLQKIKHGREWVFFPPKQIAEAIKKKLT